MVSGRSPVGLRRRCGGGVEVFPGSKINGRRRLWFGRIRGLAVSRDGCGWSGDGWVVGRSPIATASDSGFSRVTGRPVA